MIFWPDFVTKMLNCGSSRAGMALKEHEQVEHAELGVLKSGKRGVKWESWPPHIHTQSLHWKLYTKSSTPTFNKYVLGQVWLSALKYIEDSGNLGVQGAKPHLLNFCIHNTEKEPAIVLST